MWQYHQLYQYTTGYIQYPTVSEEKEKQKWEERICEEIMAKLDYT